MFGFGKKARPKGYILATTLPGSAQGDLGPSYVASYVDVHRLSHHGYSAQRSKRTRNRIAMVALGFVVIFSGLSVRLAEISFQTPGASQTRMAKSVPMGPRPEILDRNGKLLATNLPTLALEVSGKEVWDPRETAMALAKVLPTVDVVVLEKKLARKEYVEVQSDLSPQEKDAVFALGLPGIRFSRRDHRFYPHESLAPHLVGYVEKGHARYGSGGIMGLEHVLDRRDIDKDDPQKSLMASIDLRAQQVLEDVLSARMKEFSAEAAWGGVMDVRTGEMIAAASFPEFNLNDPMDAAGHARRNRMTYDRFDLGSAFKVITAASVLESDLADEQTPYDARGGFYVSGFTVKDFHGKNRVLSLTEVIQHSSNIGVARMADELGPKRQQAYLNQLGFFDALPIELMENRAPDLPRRWGPVESATVSYGHGIAVTPLHLLAGFAATLNDGIYRVPTFLKAKDEAGSNDQPTPAQATSHPNTNRVFSPQTTAAIRRILRATVTDGTAKRAEVAGYFPIGKTATADKPGRGGYLKNQRISSFVGAFPGHDPRYAIIVSLDNPQPTENTFGYATAGWTAAPAFRDLVEQLGPVLNVTMVDEEIAARAFEERGQPSASPEVDDIASLLQREGAENLDIKTQTDKTSSPSIQFSIGAEE